SVLAVDPLTPTTLYAGTSGSGVFKSIDGGGSWSAVNAGLTNPLVTALAIDPQSPSILYVGTNGGDFKTPDWGNSWSNTGLTDPYITALAVNPQPPTSLYVGTQLFDLNCFCFTGSLFKSIDGGGSWSETVGVGVTTLAIDPQTPTILYVATVPS